MVDLTADVTPLSLETVESSLYNTVQALLKKMNSQKASQNGQLRWSLQQRLESDPSCSVSLIQVLIQKLDNKLKKDDMTCKPPSCMHVIPVLHTLYYVVLQSAATIPTSLYQTVCECLMNLLILPSPYSAVALSTLRSIKMEMITPGSLYQRRVIAEQNLKNEHFTLQEKVFVLADPDVFSVPLEATVRAHLEVSGFPRNTTSMEEKVVLHVLQKGLGTTCQSSTLAQALGALGVDMVKKYFQEVVLAVEQSIEHGDQENYVNKLEVIYRDILTGSQEEITTVDHGSVCGAAMPFPEIHFHLWRYEEDLWNLLENFALKNKRNSLDSETERHRQDGGSDKRELRPDRVTFTRRNAYKNMTQTDRLMLMREKIEAFPGSPPVLNEDRKGLVARVVVMGDNRVLGRLAKAFHSIRERESKRLVLTKKLNLQLYYIAVTEDERSLGSPDSPCQDKKGLSLASTLGRVDPWYNSNINSLSAAILKLNEMHSSLNKPPQQNLFLLDTLCYYLRCGTQPVSLPLYSVKMTISSRDVSSVVEEVFVSHLEANIPEFRHIKENCLKMTPINRKMKARSVFGSVISVSYTKISLSRREVVMGQPPMAVGVEITSEPAAIMPGEDCLTVGFHSLNPIYNTTIQTQNISIKTLERRTLSVCLDRDSRRTYTDVQRIEVSPCLDPGCSVRSRFSVSLERELLLRTYQQVKRLSLPINTFSGVTL